MFILFFSHESNWSCNRDIPTAVLKSSKKKKNLSKPLTFISTNIFSLTFYPPGEDVAGRLSIRNPSSRHGVPAGQGPPDPNRLHHRRRRRHRRALASPLSKDKHHPQRPGAAGHFESRERGSVAHFLEREHVFILPKVKGKQEGMLLSTFNPQPWLVLYSLILV